jgi:hypothetical protein
MMRDDGDLEVELRVEAPGTGKQPVTCGVPWPQGRLREPEFLTLQDSEGKPIPLQARVLNRWSDGSIRWVLLDWRAEAGVFRLILSDQSQSLISHEKVCVVSSDGGMVVNTGVRSFKIGTGRQFPFHFVRCGDVPLIDGDRPAFAAEDQDGNVFHPHIESVDVEESGPVRALTYLRGALVCPGVQPLAELTARLHFFAGSTVVRFDLTLCNSRSAAHPGGLWDLGNDGSIYLRDATLRLAFPPESGPVELRCSPEVGAPFEKLALPFELYQDSSGGENWKSSNHLNRNRLVPNTFRGYRLRADGAERFGSRATPAVCMMKGGRSLGVAMPWFWQNFPKAIEAADDTLVLRLFPHQYADVHELQGGEQKTHSFYVLFGADEGIEAAERVLTWCREPARAAADPAWFCSTGAIPYLTPRADDPNVDHHALVDAAIGDSDSFDHKREVIDEYGWRHFGDIYGDHEAVFHKGPTPLVSHYNNQYDPIAGFAVQFLRSGDWRWFRHMEELAAHVIDVDIYHTDRDKAAYNHGLFWHTYHYVDADTGTHRSYPRALRRLGGGGDDSVMASGRSSHKVYALGGGPANEHNYIGGLMLHYFLTGHSASRSAALELARWVLDVDDGSKSVFRWLARGDTGLASQSRDRGYHGPGRGSANSLNTLIDAHRLSGDLDFLTKAEQLVRRCIHPADDLAARKLLDVENRWFYTMFLQALGRYLDYKVERGELEHTYAHARAALLHYARWMAQHERPTLDKPEILEYPTETWPAQDMRKSDIFYFAAKHAPEAERDRFLERGAFFFRTSVAKLSQMPTRTLARPVVLLLSNGLMHAYFEKNPSESAPPPAQDMHDFGRPEVFVPQRVRALKRFKAIVLAGAVVGATAVAYALSLLFR